MTDKRNFEIRKDFLIVFCKNKYGELSFGKVSHTKKTPKQEWVFYFRCDSNGITYQKKATDKVNPKKCIVI